MSLIFYDFEIRINFRGLSVLILPILPEKCGGQVFGHSGHILLFGISIALVEDTGLQRGIWWGQHRSLTVVRGLSGSIEFLLLVDLGLLPAIWQTFVS